MSWCLVLRGTYESDVTVTVLKVVSVELIV